MGIEVSGLLGLIIFILDIVAIVKTIQSGASAGTKILWVLVVLLLPVVGLILWALMGPRPGSAAHVS